MKSILFVVSAVMFLAGCSVFGKSDVEITPYDILEKGEQFEVRHYESLILVTTPMKNSNEKKSPFYKLFNYISGENDQQKEIKMTAPVFMDQKDGMTETMSFVMPNDFSFKTTPVPIDQAINIEEINDYTVATIKFSGRLSQENIVEHQKILDNWIAAKKYKVIGQPKTAGYNPPFTIPALRRNEILVPIEKP
jgi:hypothetical protein